LEKKRDKAVEDKGQGPRVMIVGPVDTGKSTLSKILMNYAARNQREITFVDLDVGQGSITIPGIIAAIPIDKPIPVGRQEISENAPLAYFFGTPTPGENVALYKLQIENLAKDVNKRNETNPKPKAGGLIINTCGWIENVGYELLLFAINTLKADVVVVLDQERLYSNLKKKEYTNSTINFVRLAKSGGVVTRDQIFRKKSRMLKIKEYFYGVSNDFGPQKVVLDFGKISVYRIGGGPQAPQGALPIGAESKIDPVKLTEVIPNTEFRDIVLAVSYASTLETILQSNLAGFVVVTEVNLERKKLTLLVPCSGKLPSKYFLLTNLRLLD